MMLLVAGFILVISICLCLALTRGIRRPLNEMENAAHLLAEGDLSQKITYTSKDEFGSLAESLRRTIASLQLYIREIDAGMKLLGVKLESAKPGEVILTCVNREELSQQLGAMHGGAIAAVGEAAWANGKWAGCWMTRRNWKPFSARPWLCWAEADRHRFCVAGDILYSDANGAPQTSYPSDKAIRGNQPHTSPNNL